MKRALKLSAVAYATGALVFDGFIARVALVLIARSRLRDSMPYTFDSDRAWEAASELIAEDREHLLAEIKNLKEEL